MPSTILTVTLDTQAAENVLMERTEVSALIQTGTLPESDAFTKVIKIDQHAYMLSRAMKHDDKVVVISLDVDGPIFGIDQRLRQEAFDRALRCALASLSHRGSVPVSWRPFHSGSIVSFQAGKKAATDSGRIMMELTADQSPHAFIFGLTKTRIDLASVRPEYRLFEEAILRLDDAMAKVDIQTTVAENFGDSVHLLSGSLLNKATHHLTFDDWYKSRLTVDQLKFVNHPLNQSVRVIGPAGSGKTVALVVKALRELQQAKLRGEKPRYLMMTHALMNADVIENLISAMDPIGETVKGDDGRPYLEVSTIYSLANKHMHYDLEDLEPLSFDGIDGRVMQAELISSLISEFVSNDWVAYRSGCSEQFVASIETQTKENSKSIFIWELMNEFACVLDSDGIKGGTDGTKQYLEGDRRRWMMDLITKEERLVVLELYRRFRKQLQEMNTIGVDQMISDYLNYLDSNKWEALRQRVGYDAVFVDELHLFNRLERMVFRHLTRDASCPPVVVMAYDPKQSPRDTFAGLSTNVGTKADFMRETAVGPTQKYELADIFRYTPEIARALELIDSSFPGQDLDDEWPNYKGISKIANGEKPIAVQLKNTRDIFDYVFPRAKELQRALEKDQRVAVLCASNSMFSTYAAAGKYSEDFVVISSRDDLTRMKSRNLKFVFSAPEYVAGLQFDTVLLIEVNENEVPQGPYSASATRKFVSTLYLGASRAERVLEIYCSRDGGGLSRVLGHAVADGAIEMKS